ncbi:MAG TPA: transglycosylase domain-containing protein [Candidatus Saccharimonadales bacterium]|nr:transglycosylase domain-containing protein [Candidatus Saccharimonadales bacterium]
MPKRPLRRGKPITTRTGRVLKVNRSMGERFTHMKEAKTLRKLQRMRGLPKSRLKRLAWRMHPKRLAEYWLSRDGGIMALKITGIAVLFIFVLTLGVFAYFRKDLPDIKDISGSSLGGSISYYDRTGKVLLWQDYNAVKRVPVQTEEISKYVKEATVAVEDKDFYNHRGFDVRGITRAALNDTLHHGSTQGGSTITQQLVKLTQDWQQQRTFSRKVKELILAVELERTYTKDEILTGYLNAAPYGSIDYGVQVAAADYFHKSAKDLTLPEAAMLAAIPKSPSLYSPYSGEYFNRKEFLGRYNYVLDQMATQGKITKKEAADAKNVDVLAEVQPQQTKYAGIQAPYFVLAAKNEIINKWAPKGPGSNKIGGWKVITTLDMNLQHIAEDVVQKNRSNALSHGADEEALVAEDVKTGQMIALVGGTDFSNAEHGQINYAQTNISPGSSFKPYDYAALIDNTSNAGAGSVLYDVQQPLPGYTCSNKAKPSFNGGNSGGNCLWDYDFRYPGPETLRYALGGSRNVPAVKAMLSTVAGNTTASVNKTISTANSMMSAPGAYKCYNPGVDVNTATKADETQCYGASAIGDGAYLHLDQHVNGLATLARMGQAIPATYILKLYDSKSSTKPFYEWKQPKKGDADVKQAVRPDAAYIVNNMASDPNASYLPAGYYKWHRYNGWNNAIKTGTTANGFDGLMMSWNTQFAVGSWVGYHTRNKALSGAMEYSTTPLTRGFMTAALDSLHTSAVNWTEPSDIQHLPAYVVRTHIGIGSVEPTPSTEIYPSWYKAKGASNQNATIDKVSGKLATNCTPTLAKQTLGGSAAPTSFSADIFYPPGAGASSASADTSTSDDVHSCGDTRPSITLTVADQNCSSNCTFTAFVQAGTHPFNDSQYSQYPGTVNFYVNGQLVGSKSVSDPSDTVSLSYNPTSSGSGTVTAQVTDSVLYDSTSDPVTVNFTQAAVGPLIINTATQISASWSGGTSGTTYTLTRTDTNVVLCTTTSTSCTYGIIPKNTTVRLTDSSNDTPDTKKV